MGVRISPLRAGGNKQENVCRVCATNFLPVRSGRRLARLGACSRLGPRPVAQIEQSRERLLATQAATESKCAFLQRGRFISAVSCHHSRRCVPALIDPPTRLVQQTYARRNTNVEQTAPLRAKISVATPAIGPGGGGGFALSERTPRGLLNALWRARELDTRATLIVATRAWRMINRSRGWHTKSWGWGGGLAGERRSAGRANISGKCHSRSIHNRGRAEWARGDPKAAQGPLESLLLDEGHSFREDLLEDVDEEDDYDYHSPSRVGDRATRKWAHISRANCSRQNMGPRAGGLPKDHKKDIDQMDSLNDLPVGPKPTRVGAHLVQGGGGRRIYSNYSAPRDDAIGLMGRSVSSHHGPRVSSHRPSGTSTALHSTVVGRLVNMLVRPVDEPARPISTTRVFHWPRFERRAAPRELRVRNSGPGSYLASEQIQRQERARQDCVGLDSVDKIVTSDETLAIRLDGLADPPIRFSACVCRRQRALESLDFGPRGTRWHFVETDLRVTWPARSEEEPLGELSLSSPTRESTSCTTRARSGGATIWQRNRSAVGSPCKATHTLHSAGRRPMGDARELELRAEIWRPNCTLRKIAQCDHCQTAIAREDTNQQDHQTDRDPLSSSQAPTPRSY
ncbi:Hypothetical predicted protein [Olea europaea subsp. europaea]|uniref:Uncharacterized protein n=1 Tax=Olea europaea subsp. europaea TaxID=158383 RepID=A0A8S0TKE0_OLEEU|nr:Hypothetical predicted protein [Olea europaea subsp. europaea]